MRLRHSRLAVIALSTAILVMVAGGVGVYTLTGNALAAALLGGCIAAPSLAFGIVSAHINNRVGDVMRKLRQTENTLVKSVQAGSAEVRRELPRAAAAPVPAPAPAPAPAPLQPSLLKQLLETPKTPIGPRHSRALPIDRVPISEDDRPQWITSRSTNVALELSDRAPAWKPLDLPAATSIPVAMIADEFTYQSFKPEFNAHRLTPSTWRETMATAPPAMFFCESAWSGGTPPNRPWAGQIYGSARWAQDRRSALLEILAYCRKNGIPTVFWNKEDPVHFSDRINDFIITARHFDFVFTTAEECVPLYRRDAGVEHVESLPFAVQPSIFNPLSSTAPQEAAVFAGSWYARYPRRAAAASKMMDLVLETGRDLVIYDRNYSNPKGYEYPERYQPYRRPAISFEETAEVYRANKFGITLNTITDSKTMFARRVFEMAACGNVVLSNTAAGVKHFFGDSVIYADQEPDRLRDLDGAEYARLQNAAFEIALQNTYTHRARTVLQAAGIPSADPFQRPALAARVRTWAEFEAARRAQLEGNFPELLCLAADGAEPLLLASIQRKAFPDVVADSEHRVRRGDYRSRSLLQTPHVYFWGAPNGALPPEEWFRKAQLHLAYADQPIAEGASQGIRLSARNAESVERTLMTAQQFELYVCSPIPVQTVYAL